MVVAIGAPVVGELAHLVGHRRVAGDEAAGVAGRAEVLARIERERARLPEGAGQDAVLGREVALGAVLEDAQPVRLGEVDQGGDGGGMSVEVNGDHRLGARRDRLGRRHRVHARGHRIDVHEHRSRPRAHHAGRGGDEGERRDENLVLRAQPHRLEAQLQGGGAALHRDGVRHAEGLGVGGLESIDGSSPHERGVAKDGPHRIEQLLLDGLVLAGEVEERNVGLCHDATPWVSDGSLEREASRLPIRPPRCHGQSSRMTAAAARIKKKRFHGEPIAQRGVEEGEDDGQHRGQRVEGKQEREAAQEQNRAEQREEQHRPRDETGEQKPCAADGGVVRFRPGVSHIALARAMSVSPGRLKPGSPAEGIDGFRPGMDAPGYGGDEDEPPVELRSCDR